MKRKLICINIILALMLTSCSELELDKYENNAQLHEEINEEQFQLDVEEEIIDYASDKSANKLIQAYNNTYVDEPIKRSQVNSIDRAGGYETHIELFGCEMITSYADGDLKYAIASKNSDEDIFLENVKKCLEVILEVENTSADLDSSIEKLKEEKNGDRVIIGGMNWYFVTKEEKSNYDSYELAVYSIPNW